MLNVQDRARAAFLSNVVRATNARKAHTVQVRRSGYDSEVGKLGAADIERLAKENGFEIVEANVPAPRSRNYRVFHLAVNQSA